MTAVGCSSGATDDSDTGEPVAAITTVGDMASFALPLDAYQINSSTQDLTVKAFSAVYRKCMAQFGFVNPPRTTSGTPALRHERRYGITSAATSKVHGYRDGRSSDRSRSDRRVPRDAEVAISRGTGVATYQGRKVPPGGCMGETERALAENLPDVRDERLADKLASEAYDRSKQDSRVRQVFSAWSDCMKQSGYNYADPMEAMDDPAFIAPRPGASEIKTAMADIECKNRTRLVDVWASVETAYQRRLLDRNAEALNDVKDYLLAKEQAAAKLLGRAG